MIYFFSAAKDKNVVLGGHCEMIPGPLKFSIQGLSWLMGIYINLKSGGGGGGEILGETRTRPAMVTCKEKNPGITIITTLTEKVTI